MRPLYLINADVYAPNFLGKRNLLLSQGKIAAIQTTSDNIPEDAEVLDLHGCSIGPGFIDLHTHGCNGFDVMDGKESIAGMAQFLVTHGVTSFLPTTVTASIDTLESVVWSIESLERIGCGANILGINLEGPFLNPKKRGAQSPEFCLPATRENLDRLLLIAQNHVKVITVAPDIEGGCYAVEQFANTGIIVSVGHTEATTEVMNEAIRRGAKQVTHLFNAMPALHHRDPGVIGAGLTDNRVMVELIADGVHVHPLCLQMAVAAKGADSVVLISDSMAAAGCQDGSYKLGSVDVFVNNGEARLDTGQLAGSTLTLDRAVLNIAQWTNAGLSGAWQMASLNPARQLGIDSHKGKIAIGYDADLTVLSASGESILTIVAGLIHHNLIVS